MSKKLKKPPFTLEDTWKYCLQMWAWIAKHRPSRKDIEELKDRWLDEHGFDKDEIEASCFFCLYDSRGECHNCPAVKVDKTFDCTNEEYNYRLHPHLFYRELKQLNRKRRKK